MDRIASRPIVNRHLKFSHAAGAHGRPQPTRTSNIAQSLTLNWAPIGAKRLARLHSVITLVISLFGGFSDRFAKGVPHFVRVSRDRRSINRQRERPACWLLARRSAT